MQQHRWQDSTRHCHEKGRCLAAKVDPPNRIPIKTGSIASLLIAPRKYPYFRRGTSALTDSATRSFRRLSLVQGMLHRLRNRKNLQAIAPVAFSAIALAAVACTIAFPAHARFLC
jgi:hypothetical protein